MEVLLTSIRETEGWLRDNPHADPEARHEMSFRLRDMNEQLTELKQELNNQENEE